MRLVIPRRRLLQVLATGVLPAGSWGCGRIPRPITTPPKGMRFEHPASEAELVALVERARRERAQLRVRGSLHSVGTAIWTDPGSRNINVQLDRYNRIVAFDEANRRVTVQAGMHLGVDPRDPNSNPDNSLLYALNRRGWALPDLGGITHQTVGGFLSTGSAGGSVFHDVGESLAGVRIVAGDGKIYELVPAPDRPGDAEENPFFAAGVAMGLLGILSTATFQCVESFDIIGRQITRSFAQSPVDLFGSRGGGLRNFLEVNEYNRLLVFPQPKVERVQFWSARRAGPGDRSVIFKRGERTRKPLQAMPEALENIAYRIYEHVDKTEPPYDDRKTEFMRDMLRLFMPDTDERFWDRWYLALPMDNQVSDELMPTEFTELFIDIDKTEAVMRELDAFWRADRNMERTGPFATEIYPAKASKFWLAASHGQNSVRIDVFWFKTGQTDPSRAFYPRYWQLLEKYGFRFHWGKHLSSPDSSTGIEYRRKQLPKWDQFLRLRERLDPDQIFVSSYWRKHLGIPGR